MAAPTITTVDPQQQVENRGIWQKNSRKAIGEFNWQTDYLKFCQLLELEPSEYADDQYRHFQKLAEALTRFNAESLALVIDKGLGNKLISALISIYCRAEVAELVKNWRHD